MPLFPLPPPSISSGRVPLEGNILGILFMTVATCAGAMTSLIVKELSPESTLMVMLTLRFAFSLPFIAMAALAMRNIHFLQINRWDRLIMRMIVGQIGITFWFLSVAHTSLGQATALFQSSAIFVTVLSPFILQEKVGIYRGGAVLLGLLGILMITDPLGGALNIGTLYGLGSALAGAFLVVLLRMLGRTEEPVTVALWHNLAGIVIYPVAVIALFEIDVLGRVTVDYFLFLLLLGVGSTFVQIGFTAAYRHGEAAALAPIRYLSVPLAAILGYLIWSEDLSITEMLGMLVVVASCIFISYREYTVATQKAT
jgi:drug/metabolite transporter (DMT)-like permease